MPEKLAERLAILFRHAPNAIILTRADRQIDGVNGAFCRMFGYTQEEAKALHAQDIYLSHSDFLRTREAVEASEHVSKQAHAYITCVRKDRTSFPARADLLQLRDDDMVHIGFAALITDLTALAGSGHDIAASVEMHAAERAFLTSLYQRTPAMMHSIGPDGKLVVVSDAWLERLGYRAEDVIGRPSTDFLTEESKRYAREVVLPQFWRDRSCTRVPYTMLASDGSEVEVELSAIIETASGDARTLAMLEDVTERNRAMRDLERRNGDLAEFAHATAHDLQAPLRHITLFSRLIQDESAVGQTENMDDHLTIIADSAERLSRMVRGLLDFASAGASRLALASANLGETVAHAVAQHKVEIDQTGATVEIGPMPTVVTDHLMMQQVLSNLIGNALKYVAPGVRPQIQVTARGSPNEVLITVADNGIGVPEVFRERIFQPLKRLHGPDSDYTGTGIGLALCRKIVYANEGELWVTDNPSGGSMFQVRLPLQQSQDAESP